MRTKYLAILAVGLILSGAIGVYASTTFTAGVTVVIPAAAAPSPAILVVRSFSANGVIACTTLPLSCSGTLPRRNTLQNVTVQITLVLDNKGDQSATLSFPCPTVSLANVILVCPSSPITISGHDSISVAWSARILPAATGTLVLSLGYTVG